MNKEVLVCGVGRMGRRHIRAAQYLGHAIVGFFDIVAVNHPYSEIGLSNFIRDTVQSNEFGGVSSCHTVGRDAGVAMSGIHFFDLFEFVAGSRIIEISSRLIAQLVENPCGPQYNDSSEIIDAIAASGARLHIDISNNHGVGWYGIFMGKAGSVRVDLLTNKYELSLRSAATRHLPTTQYDAASSNSSVDAPPITDIYDGERFLRYLVPCHVSSETGRNFIYPLGPLLENRKFHWA